MHQLDDMNDAKMTEAWQGRELEPWGPHLIIWINPFLKAIPIPAANVFLLFPFL